MNSKPGTNQAAETNDFDFFPAFHIISRITKGVRMIKSDIIDAVSEKLTYNRPKAEMAVEDLLQLLKDSLKDGGRIELRGFGVFLVRPKKTGVGRNPKTGEQIPLQPGKVIKFKPSKDVLSAESAPQIIG